VNQLEIANDPSKFGQCFEHRRLRDLSRERYMGSKGYRIVRQLQVIEVGAQCAVKLQQRPGALADSGHDDSGFPPILVGIEADFEWRVTHRSANLA
jgi:hypothetical protein